MEDKADDVAQIATIMQVSDEAERVGMKAGDVVIGVGENVVEVGFSAADFKALLVESKERPCTIRIERSNTHVRSGTL